MKFLKTLCPLHISFHFLQVFFLLFQSLPMVFAIFKILDFLIPSSSTLLSIFLPHSYYHSLQIYISNTLFWVSNVSVYACMYVWINVCMYVPHNLNSKSKMSIRLDLLSISLKLPDTWTSKIALLISNLSVPLCHKEEGIIWWIFVKRAEHV